MPGWTSEKSHDKVGKTCADQVCGTSTVKISGGGRGRLKGCSRAGTLSSRT